MHIASCPKARSLAFCQTHEILRCADKLQRTNSKLHLQAYTHLQKKNHTAIIKKDFQLRALRRELSASPASLIGALSLGSWKKFCCNPSESWGDGSIKIWALHCLVLSTSRRAQMLWFMLQLHNPACFECLWKLLGWSHFSPLFPKSEENCHYWEHFGCEW